MRPCGRSFDPLRQSYVPNEPRDTQLLYKLDAELPSLQLFLPLGPSIYHEEALKYPPAHMGAMTSPPEQVGPYSPRSSPYFAGVRCPPHCPVAHLKQAEQVNVPGTEDGM